MKNLFILEYSRSLNTFYKRSLSQVIIKNLKAFFREQPHDRMIIGIFETKKEREDFYNQVKTIFETEPELSTLHYDTLMKLID